MCSSADLLRFCTDGNGLALLRAAHHDCATKDEPDTTSRTSNEPQLAAANAATGGTLAAFLRAEKDVTTKAATK
jgi:hypothetical protein